MTASRAGAPAGDGTEAVTTTLVPCSSEAVTTPFWPAASAASATAAASRASCASRVARRCRCTIRAITTLTTVAARQDTPKLSSPVLKVWAFR